MKNHTFSVIIPVFQVQNYLTECVDSVVNQSIFSDISILLVDDGSNDFSSQICDSYASEFDNIIVVHQKNKGLSGARNSALKILSIYTKWVSFLDSDDFIDCHYFNNLYSIALSNNAQIACCCFGDITMNTVKSNILICNPEDVFTNNMLFKGFSSVSSCGKLISRDLLYDIYFPEGKIHEDRFTTHKYLFKSNNIVVTDACYYHYRINDNGITHSKWNIHRMDDIDACYSQILFFERNEAFKAKHMACFQYLDKLFINLRELQKHPNYKQLYKLLKQKYRYEFKKYKKELFITPFNHPELYVFNCPFFYLLLLLRIFIHKCIIK